MEKFYQCLFNVHENVCLGYSPKDTTVYFDWEKYVSFSPPSHNFVCINPLRINFDKEPTEPWHAPNRGRRADCNVIAYRNILCEFDNVSLTEQMRILKESKLPYSTLVFSGGKSFHAIICLEESLPSLEEYKRLAKRVFAKLPGVDRANSNPSRFSRTPGAIRENGQKQDLCEVNGRVKLQTLLDWLGPEIVRTGLTPIEYKSEKGILRPTTKYFLAFGAEPGSWNVCMFKAACDMTRAQCTEEEIIDKMTAISGHLDSRDRATIKSGIRAARRA